MINDFDLLLKQCKTRALKRILRIVLRIFSSLLLLGLGLYGYYQWKGSTQQPVIIKPSPKAVAPVPKEENNTIAPAPALVKVAIAAPMPMATTALPVVSPIPSVAVVNQPSSAPKSRLLEVNNVSTATMTPEQTYQRSPKFETALGIARDFYTKEEYAQAAIWAKKANQMNREAEEAWLLYAKSYYAQGKKSEAIAVLELFLNYKDSKAASDLIKAWK